MDRFVIKIPRGNISKRSGSSGDEIDENNDVRHKRVKGEKVTKDEMFVGAHVSIKGGLKCSALEADSIGAKGFAMFLCNQKTWANKPLKEEDASQFRDTYSSHGFKSHLILPHASFLLNCGSPKDDVLQKSRDGLLDGLKRCEMLDIDNYNFHPGSTCGQISVEECLTRISESINYAHANSNKAVAVIENMSKQGNTVGGDFKEIGKIIAKVKDKSRVGVCLDTCHAFAAGYNLANEKGFYQMLDEFDTHIGLKYLKALHLNDSKGKVGSHLDRHENIGKGFIGIDGFKLVMNEARFKNIPMILETPDSVDGIYAKEIKLLYSLIE